MGMPPRSLFNIERMDIWNNDHEQVRQLIAQGNLIPQLNGQALSVCSQLLYTMYPDLACFHWDTSGKAFPTSYVLDCVLRFLLTMGNLKGPIEGLRTS